MENVKKARILDVIYVVADVCFPVHAFLYRNRPLGHPIRRYLTRPPNSLVAAVMEAQASSQTRRALVHIMAFVEDRAGRGGPPRSIHVIPTRSNFDTGFSVNEVPARGGLHPVYL